MVCGRGEGGEWYVDGGRSEGDEWYVDASIMINALKGKLCSKLCWHNICTLTRGRSECGEWYVGRSAGEWYGNACRMVFHCCLL